MIRDFSYDNYQRIEKELSQIEDQSIWDKVVGFYRGVVKTVSALVLMNPLAAFVHFIDLYNKNVVWKKRDLLSELRLIFIDANSHDRVFADKLNILYEEGGILLKELRQLTDIATPEKYSEVLQMPELNLNLFKNKKSSISDEMLIEYCSNNASNVWMIVDGMGSSLSYTSGVHNDINLFELYLMGLFNGKDILYDSFFNFYGNYATDLEQYIKEKIVSGADGFSSVQEIARELDIPEDYVLYLLGAKGKYDVNGYLLDSKNKFRYDELRLSTEMKKIIEKNINNLKKNEQMLMAFCSSIGVDYNLYKAAQSKETNSYMLAMYKEALAKTVDSICEDKPAELYPSEIKDSVSTINKIHKLAIDDRDKYLKHLKELWQRGDLSDTEYKRLQLIEEAFKDIKDIDKFLKDEQKAVDFLNIWLSDYEAKMEVLDSLSHSSYADDTYLLAVESLKNDYSHSFQAALSDVVETSIKKGVDYAMTAALPALPAAEAFIDVAGKLTGISKHTDAVQDVLNLYNMSIDATGIYQNSLENAAQSTAGISSPDELDDAQAASLLDLRTSFEYMKQTYIQYYEAQIEYYEGYVLSVGADESKKAYLQYELSKIKDLELGEQYIPLTYEAYQAR